MEGSLTMFTSSKTLPGKNINLALSMAYLSLLVLLPMLFLILSLSQVTWEKALEILTTKRALEAFRVSFSTAIIAACIDLVFGVIIAWTLVKYRFLGRRLFDSIVDLPFAMPTAVSGIALAALYSDKGWIGSHLGLKIAYTPFGILVALVFIGLPFVVRSVQPAIVSLDLEMEEAAASLGAKRPMILKKIVLPQLLPSILTGFTMSLARGLGEYGSVIFIAGNIPYVSEIIPLLIVIELEQFDYEAATVIAVAMLLSSFLLLILLGILGNWIRKRQV